MPITRTEYTSETADEQLAEDKAAMHATIDKLAQGDMIFLATSSPSREDSAMFSNATGLPLLQIVMSSIILLGHDILFSQGKEANDDTALYTGLQMVSQTAKDKADYLAEQRDSERKPKHVVETVEDQAVAGDTGDKKVH